jgi:enamine deaminase RidA (YjgF/YER057c/UK114 family)
MDAVLRAVGASVDDITMVHIFLVNYTPDTFEAMNRGYLDFFGNRPLPARITTGCTNLALGATVEIDMTAYISH